MSRKERRERRRGRERVEKGRPDSEPEAWFWDDDPVHTAAVESEGRGVWHLYLAPEGYWGNSFVYDNGQWYTRRADGERGRKKTFDGVLDSILDYF